MYFQELHKSLGCVSLLSCSWALFKLDFCTLPKHAMCVVWGWWWCWWWRWWSLWWCWLHRISLIGNDEAVTLNAVAQKFINTLSKPRLAEDKVVKALPTWSESELDDLDAPSHSNMVNYLHFADYWYTVRQSC